jgi:hypothetical protein
MTYYDHVWHVFDERLDAFGGCVVRGHFRRRHREGHSMLEHDVPQLIDTSADEHMHTLAAARAIVAFRKPWIGPAVALECCFVPAPLIHELANTGSEIVFSEPSGLFDLRVGVVMLSNYLSRLLGACVGRCVERVDADVSPVLAEALGLPPPSGRQDILVVGSPFYSCIPDALSEATGRERVRKIRHERSAFLPRHGVRRTD